MSFTHTQVINPATENETLDQIIASLVDFGFNPTDWTNGDMTRDWLMTHAMTVSDLLARAAYITKQTNVLEAEGEGLTILASGQYDTTRSLGLKTEGTFALDLAVGQGPYEFFTNDLRVTDGNVVFTNSNVASVVINAATPFVTMSFQAEQIGTAYNIADRDFDDPLQLITSRPGLTVNTTAVSPSSTWITTPGTDDETDQHLRDRLRTKMPMLTKAEMFKQCVENICLNVQGISKVFTDDDKGDYPGSFTTYVSNDLITATPTQVTECYQRSTSSFQNGANRVIVQEASASIFDRQIKVFYKPSYTPAQVMAGIEGTLDSLIGSSPIGGVSFGNEIENIFNMGDVVAGLEDQASINKVVITPSGDISLFDTSLNNQPAKLVKPSFGYDALITLVKDNA